MRKLLCTSTSFSLLILIATVTACGVNNKNHPKQRRALTENQLLEKLLETTQFDMVSGSPVDKDTPVERSQFWLVPKGAEISKDSVYNRFETIAGGPIFYWKFTSHEMKWDVYHQGFGDIRILPITAKGITMGIQSIGMPLVVHTAYLINADSICQYTAEILEQHGLLGVEGNETIFKFPKNTSTEERLWLFSFYYKDKKVYDGIRSESWQYRYQSEEEEWEVTKLQFLQMGDSAYYYTDKQLAEKAEFLMEEHYYPLFRRN